ncbi:MAG: electron transport complex subunit RsxE [Verrucomicrobiota bacterium]|nr:electron transport complex subunit RsxE [Verrucomicrobiota bacterium]
MSLSNGHSLLGELTKGFIKENPILVTMLGLCAALACSTNATDALGMGVAFSFVMVCSNIVVAIIRKLVPSQARIPVFITVISTFVTIIDYALKAYSPTMSQSLGVFVPLIVVNCIVMARAEAFSSKNTVMASVMDGIGMGIGFTVIITLIGAIREAIGNGSVFGRQFMPASYQPFIILLLPPGAFLVIGFLMAIHRKIMATFYKT